MRLIFLCLISLLLTLPGHAQERVRNVRIRVLDSTRLDIRYDLLTTQPGDSVYLEMRSRLRGALRILPEFIRGDIGVDISAGIDRHIIWDALANGYALNEEVQAKVLVKTGTGAGLARPTKKAPVVVQAPIITPTEAKTVTPKPTESVVITEPKPAPPTAPTATTPQNQPKRNQPTKPSVFAVDSAAIPTTTPVQKTAPPAVAITPAQPPTSTTTSIQVQPVTPQAATIAIDSMPKVHRRYAGPAWALLSAVAPGIGNIFVQTPKPKVGVRPLVTVLCYGAVVYGLMERQKASDTYAIYEQQKNMIEGEPYYQTANDHHHRYFLATRGAVLVAATDVVLTFIKGLRNSHLQRKAQRIEGVNVRPGWQAGQLTAILHYSF